MGHPIDNHRLRHSLMNVGIRPDATAVLLVESGN
jgi:hypothetical protein